MPNYYELKISKLMLVHRFCLNNLNFAAVLLAYSVFIKGGSVRSFNVKKLEAFICFIALVFSSL